MRLSINELGSWNMKKYLKSQHILPYRIKYLILNIPEQFLPEKKQKYNNMSINYFLYIRYKNK